MSREEKSYFEKQIFNLNQKGEKKVKKVIWILRILRKGCRLLKLWENSYQKIQSTTIIAKYTNWFAI